MLAIHQTRSCWNAIIYLYVLVSCACLLGRLCVYFCFVCFSPLFIFFFKCVCVHVFVSVFFSFCIAHCFGLAQLMWWTLRDIWYIKYILFFKPSNYCAVSIAPPPPPTSSLETRLSVRVNSAHFGSGVFYGCEKLSNFLWFGGLAGCCAQNFTSTYTAVWSETQACNLCKLLATSYFDPGSVATKIWTDLLLLLLSAATFQECVFNALLYFAWRKEWFR